MNGKLKKNIGFSLLPFAFLFLFEPGLTLIDPLPDFIGYIIICLALTNLGDINFRISDALGGFKKGIVISLLRLVAIYLLDSYFVTDELSVGLLLFVFVFSFFELIILIPAYKSLFEGLLSLGMLHDGNFVYYKKTRKRIGIDKKSGEKTLYIRESKRNVTEKTFFLTATVLIVRCLAVTLPEFTSLATNTAYEFVHLLRLFGFIVALPFGIVWLIKIIKYFVSVRKDTPFIKSLSELYLSEMKDRPNFFTVRELNVGLCIMLAAFVVSFDFYNNYINLIPNLLFYLILIISAVFLRKFSKKWIALCAISGVGAIISAVTRHFAKSLYFDPSFSPEAIKKDLGAYLGYYRVVSFNILDSVWMLITVIGVFLLLWDIYKLHSNIAVACANKESKEYREHKRSFVIRSISALSLATLTSAGSMYYVLSQPFENSGEWYFYYAAIIAIVISVSFAFVASYFVGFIINSIKFRYRMDI